MQVLSVSSHAFSHHEFERVVKEAARIGEDAELPTQVRYLLTYLRDLREPCKGLWLEHPYVDRHFVAEYQGYYATTLRPPPNVTTRLHVFSERWSVDVIERELTAADDGERDAIRKKLQDSYIGFVVVRPLPEAPIGRTVLRTYRGKPSRCYGPKPPPHRVHILGMTLKAHGVQFQQQDSAVGACATAAIWCAVAAVARRDGGRALTPLAVTENSYRSLPTVRSFPASGGLPVDSMIAGINASGFSPDIFKPDPDPRLFQLELMTYLRSGIPVVLQVCTPDDFTVGHAITLVGFRTSDEEEQAEDIIVDYGGAYPIRCRGMSKVYAHDDRIGPYARMRWSLIKEGRRETLYLEFHTDQPGFDDLKTPTVVASAIAPMYPKIRISADDLCAVASEAWGYVRHMTPPEGRDGLRVEMFLTQSGTYKTELSGLSLGPTRAFAAARTLYLSRYVGIVRFFSGDSWVADVVCDATDILRAEWQSVLAILPADPAVVDRLQPGFAMKGVRVL